MYLQKLFIDFSWQPSLLHNYTPDEKLKRNDMHVIMSNYNSYNYDLVPVWPEKRAASFSLNSGAIRDKAT